jgi:hypothetical protein
VADAREERKARFNEEQDAGPGHMPLDSESPATSSSGIPGFRCAAPCSVSTCPRTAGGREPMCRWAMTCGSHVEVAQ